MSMCGKYQLHRNKQYFNPERQRKRMIELKEKLEKYVEEKEPLTIKLLARKNNLSMERSNTKGIKSQICNVKEMVRKIKKILKNGMRIFFEC